MSTTRSLPLTKTPPEVDAWHATGIEEIFEVFETTSDGLSTKEAGKRLNKYGSNAFTEVQGEHVFARIFEQLRSPLAFVLVVAFVITLVLQEYVDAGVILFALSIAVFVGVLQEGKASRAFKKLADSQVKMATVFREGHKHEIVAREVVVGDIVEIIGGNIVPADVRLFESKKLAVNESALTGEWIPVRKHSDLLEVGLPFSERKNMAWMGTYAVEGVSRGVVVATGDETAVGKIALDLTAIIDEETPLQGEMKQVSKLMFYLISTLVLIIFAIGVYEGLPLNDMLLMSIAVAVASVPEGLPAAVTIVLAVSMETLLRRGGLVRNLLAAETLGSTTYVLTDKTGTLTVARMVLTGVVHSDATNVSPSSWRDDREIKSIFDTALCASDAYRDEENNKVVLRGDPIEQSILEASYDIGLDPERGSLRAKRNDFLAFTSENRFAIGLVEHGKSPYRLCVNGAPEYLLEHAKKIHERHGVRTMTSEDRSAYESAILTHTKEGKRLIAVAYRDVSYSEIPENDEPSEKLISKDLVFMGILIFNDPVRKRVADAISGVKDAGAQVLLITGDNPQTALSVARTVGIAGQHETALTGDDIAELGDDELLDVMGSVHVFARVLPQQKMRIAQVLQARGEVVAMTGDGINDAPALRRANIGISVGSGTEVAKEASDLVLIDDSFEIIYSAIEEGRRIIANLRKIVGYLLSTSLSEVVLIGAALVTGSALPLLPAQILWANVIEEGLMSFAFAFEKGDKNAMKQKPQDIHEEGILSAQMIRFIIFVVCIHGTLLLSLYFFLQSLQLPLEELRSVMFLVVAIDSLFMAFAFRSLHVPLWRIPLQTNLFFIGSFVISSALLGVVLTIPFFQYLLSYQPIPFFDVCLVIAFSITTLLIIETGKWLFFERKQRMVE